METGILEVISKLVKENVGEEHQVFVREVRKNNETTKHAVVIRENKSNRLCIPLIYIDDMLEMFEAGKTDLSEIVNEIVNVYRSHHNAGDLEDIIRGLSKEQILKNVMCQLVNRQRNEESLKEVPHKNIMDMSVIYRLIVKEDGEGNASILMNYGLCDSFRISPEELDIAAMTNTGKRSFEIIDMESLLSELSGMPKDVSSQENLNMYVLTSSTKLNGSVVMLYPEYFKKLADKLNSDLYILPSSIHEVIAVPVSAGEPSALSEIVYIVNNTSLREEEYLSNNVYKYDRASNCISITAECDGTLSGFSL